MVQLIKKEYEPPKITWEEFSKSRTYQKSSDVNKLQMKYEYARRHILTDPDYEKISKEAKVKVLEEFGNREDYIRRGYLGKFLKGHDFAQGINQKSSLFNPISPKQALSIFRAGFSGEPVSNILLEFEKQQPGFLNRTKEMIDYPSEKIAQVIEPSPDENINVEQGATPLWGRYFAASMLRYFKPTDVATMQIGGKALGVVGKAVGKGISVRPDIGLGIIGAGTGAASGYHLDEENRLRGALLGGVVGLATGFTGGKIADVRRADLRSFFYTKHGADKELKEILNFGELEKEFGHEKAKEIAKKLFYAQENITSTVTRPGYFSPIKTLGKTEAGKVLRINKGQEVPIGTKLTIKKGQILPLEDQELMGRMFREELDLGGRRIDFPKGPREVSSMQKTIEEKVGYKEQFTEDRIFREVQARMGFNPRIVELQSQIQAINSKIGSAELKAKSQVGKVFRSETGHIEKIIDIAKGKGMGRGVSLVSEPIAPNVGETSTGAIPKDLTFPGQKILRSRKQVSKADILIKPTALEKKSLFLERKMLLKELEKEQRDIEVGVRSLHSVFDRKFTEQVRTNPRYQQFFPIVREARNLMDDWSKDLKGLGITTEKANEIIQERMGTYQARIYKHYLVENKKSFDSPFVVKKLKTFLNGLKSQKDLSYEVQRELGLITAPALPVYLRGTELSATVANERVFKSIAANPEWTFDQKIVTKNSELMKILHYIPDSPIYGSLRNKYVTRPVFDNVNDIAVGKISGPVGELFDFYSKGLSAFKYGKVVLSAAAWSRNFVTNTIMSDISGLDHARQAILYPQAFRSYLTKDKIYQEFKNTGLFRGQWFGDEVQKIERYFVGVQKNGLEKALESTSTSFNNIGKLYQANDDLHKMVLALGEYQKTGSAKLAVEHGLKWGFNYRDIPTAVKVGKHIQPFMTYTYKSVPRIAETIVENPLVLYKYNAFFNSFNDASRQTLGISKDEYEKAVDLLPKWHLKSIGSMPTMLLLPQKNKNGDLQFLSLEYYMPLGFIPDVASKVFENPIEALAALIGNPFLSVPVDIGVNKQFTGKSITSPLRSDMENIQQLLGYVVQQFGPSLMPRVLPGVKGGYAAENIYDALEGTIKGGYKGETKKNTLIDPEFQKLSKEAQRIILNELDEQEGIKYTLSEALINATLGLKAINLDIEKSKKFHGIAISAKIKELKKERRSFMRNPNLSENEKNKITEKYKFKVKELMNEKRRVR